MDGKRRLLAQRAAAEGTGAGAAQAAVAAAWASALVRAVAQGCGLTLGGGALRHAPMRPAELAEQVPDHALLCRLEVPGGGGACGIAALSPDLLAGLLEWQTLGRLSPEAPPPRRPTRTDAAMVGGLLDAALAALDAAGPGAVLPGLRVAAALPDARALALLPEEAALLAVTVEVDLPGTARRGALILALPLAQAVPAAAAAVPVGPAFAAQVMDSAATLDAVIARITLPLADLLRLAPGDGLRLGAAAVDRIDLTGADGIRRAGARLGQSRGMRAVRLSETALPAGRARPDRIGPIAPLDTRPAAPEPAETAAPLRATGT
jgi:flagellar motor switch protein FliM